MGRALGGLDAERGQPALAAAAGHDVAALDRFGQREQRAGRGERPVDDGVGDAVVGDDGEAGAAEGVAERGRGGGGVALDQAERDRRDIGDGHGRLRCGQRPAGGSGGGT